MHRIGLFAGGAGWQAGVEYIHNLIYALNALPPGEKQAFEVYLLLGDPAREPLYQKALPMVHGILPFQFSKSGGGRKTPLFKKIFKMKPASTPEKIFMPGRPVAFDFLYPVIYSDYQHLRFPCPWGAWIPDIQHKHFPDFFPADQVRRRDEQIRRVFADAPAVVVSSESTRSDLTAHYPEVDRSAGSVKVLHFCCPPKNDRDFSGPAEETRGKYHLPSKYFSVCNQFWRHKNHLIIFEALRRLKNQCPDAQVVCTGGVIDGRNPDYFNSLLSDLRTHDLFSQVHILGNISRADQWNVMRGSVAVIQPSLFEGWSTVVEDARSLGKISVLSDIDVHREQDPPGALYFNPGAPEELAQHMRSLWNAPRSGTSSDTLTRTASQLALQRSFARRFLEISGLISGG